MVISREPAWKIHGVQVETVRDLLICGRCGKVDKLEHYYSVLDKKEGEQWLDWNHYCEWEASKAKKVKKPK